MTVDVMIRQHVDAFVNNIGAHADFTAVTFEDGPIFPTVVFDSDVPGRLEDRPEFYVLVYTDNGTRTAERLTGEQSTARFRHTVMSVGSTPRQARWVSERVFERALGRRLEVAGRNCTVVRHQSSLPLQKDDDLPGSAWYCVDEFSWESDPA